MITLIAGAAGICSPCQTQFNSFWVIISVEWTLVPVTVFLRPGVHVSSILPIVSQDNVHKRTEQINILNNKRSFSF